MLLCHHESHTSRQEGRPDKLHAETDSLVMVASKTIGVMHGMPLTTNHT